MDAIVPITLGLALVGRVAERILEDTDPDSHPATSVYKASRRVGVARFLGGCAYFYVVAYHTGSVFDPTARNAEVLLTANVGLTCLALILDVVHLQVMTRRATPRTAEHALGAVDGFFVDTNKRLTWLSVVVALHMLRMHRGWWILWAPINFMQVLQILYALHTLAEGVRTTADATFMLRYIPTEDLQRRLGDTHH